MHQNREPLGLQFLTKDSLAEEAVNLDLVALLPVNPAQGCDDHLGATDLHAVDDMRNSHLPMLNSASPRQSRCRTSAILHKANRTVAVMSMKIISNGDAVLSWSAEITLNHINARP
jgi:hypothetical protein